MKCLLVIVSGIFLASFAHAESILVALRGDQLASYSIQKAGASTLAFSPSLTDSGSDEALVWKKTSDGYTCKTKPNWSTDDICWVSNESAAHINFNDFFYAVTYTIASEGVEQGKSITNKTIDQLKSSEGNPTMNETLAESLFNVKNSIVFTKDGSCFSYELRFFADSQTKQVTRYWFESVAAHCP